MTRPSPSVSSTAPPPSADDDDLRDAEEANEYPMWADAARAVENGECGAQLEIEDRELRRSLIRNVAAELDSASRKAREECARAVCPDKCGNPEQFGPAWLDVLFYGKASDAGVYVHDYLTPDMKGCQTRCHADAIHRRWPPAPRPPAEEEK